MNISCGTNGKYGPTGTYGMHYGTAGWYSNDKYNTYGTAGTYGMHYGTASWYSNDKYSTYGTAGTYMVVTAGSYLWLGTAD